MTPALFTREFRQTYPEIHAKASEITIPLEEVLFDAIRKHRIDIAWSVLEKGANVNSRNQAGTTPLLLAVAHNNPAMVRLFLEKNADLRARNPLGETPLLKASFWGYLEVARALIKTGADVNERNPAPTGWTPLHRAAFRGNIEMIKLLLHHGANPHAELAHTDGWFTPLRLARWYRQDSAVRFLKASPV